MSGFRLTSDPIGDAPLLKSDRTAGAVSVFVGKVRDHNEGRPVRQLEYEAYPELADKEGDRIVSEAKGKFPVLDVECVHRVGKLELGDVAIRVEASGAHRAEAIRACEWVVEEVKRRVPIWKKEHYAEGDSGWVNATTPGAPAILPSDYYRRQITLAEVGPDGQDRLRSMRVLVVGAGGIGCPALTYLVAAGVGYITIVDGDRVEISNLHRQTLFGVDDLGMPKAVAAGRRLRSLNPLVEVAIVPERLSVGNAVEMVESHDLILDGTDRLATKFLLNRVCVGLGKPLLVASIHRWEGQIQMVVPGGPCLECLWPEPPEDGCVGTCSEVGVLGVTPGMLGTFQASEALKWRLGLPSPLCEGRLILIDLLSLSLQTLGLGKRPDCHVCGPDARPLEVLPVELDISDPILSDFDLFDIREADEVVSEPVEGLVHRPLSNWIHSDLSARPLLLVCATGVRSRALASRLRKEGRLAYSLEGGVTAYRRLAAAQTDDQAAS